MDYGGVITDGPQALDLVLRARASGVSTALVSDAHVVPDDCVAAFDLVVLGSSLGVRKPDPELFRRVADLLGVTAEQCVVVDDLARNIRGARAVGAVGVHHHDLATTVTEVEILLDLHMEEGATGG
jgi:HAD superfamily hydrolase (TIGR01509 family)